VGDHGRPVAHTLLELTPRGWIAMGAGNSGPDFTPVRSRNYIGTVVKAYAPNPRIGSSVVQAPLVSGSRLALLGD